jgi:hypothetical protein
MRARRVWVIYKYVSAPSRRDAIGFTASGQAAANHLVIRVGADPDEALFARIFLRARLESQTVRPRKD